MKTPEQKAIDAERSRAYRAAYPDRVRATNRRHYDAHREERIEYAKQNHAENREARNARQRERRQDPIAGPALREKERQQRAAFKENHPERAKARLDKRLAPSRLATHGITREQHDLMLLAQGNACAICRLLFTETPRIDHDHATGAVRGLLCHHCNVALGLLRDDIFALRSAIAYLEAAA